MAEFTNRLSRETSPYLLQHAHNPVDWYPWGQEAFEKARKEDKPVLVSIGYAACHWCHVMERESFENEDTAQFMNEHFVNIKIDREERPDLDHIYMDAVQAISGSGGWPLNVFLTPELKPFYGGTYFPPQRAFNRASWLEVLTGISNAFKEKREEIDAQAESLTDHLLQANRFGFNISEGDPLFEKIFNKANVEAMAQQMLSMADKREGGFGNAPKFPQTFVIRYLLHHYKYTGHKDALDQALLSLDKMAMGGIYDQLGGGFARYSTDAEWLAPHFEKMLYDNALLVVVYLEAFQITGNTLYERVVRETLDFVERELCSNQSGFYSALDADSEGVEGKFYVWTEEEVKEVLQEDARLFSAYHDVTAHGNWEETNILRLKKDRQTFATEQGVGEEELEGILRRSRVKLMQRRDQRIRPLTDDKILLGWNALMNYAYSKAYAVLGDDHYREIAVANMEFLSGHFKTSESWDCYHTYKEGIAKYPAFLDDYAFLIQAMIALQEITGNAEYLQEAVKVTDFVIENFSEAETGMFYFTGYKQEDVVIRKKELYDGAIPSGNATMAWNLFYLGTLIDKAEWKERAIRICSGLQELVVKYASSFAVWATFLQAITFGLPEIVLLGEDLEDIMAKHKALMKRLVIPHVYQFATKASDEYPLMAGKPVSHDGQIFLCQNYACQQPVNQVDQLFQMLENG